nr:retrotransposon protein, putative, Ty1-copia subclass [Tanacetum cinerariifolium]
MDSDSAYMMAASKVPMLKPENGPSLPKTQVVEGVTTLMPITSVEDKAQRRLEVKARTIEKRFGGNAATKKTQRNLLKQQYENFTASNSEMLDQTFNRIQKLISQLELLGEKLSQEDQNFLRNLSQEWNTHDVVWKNKADLDTMSRDGLYNNLKVYEPEFKGIDGFKMVDGHNDNEGQKVLKENRKEADCQWKSKAPRSQDTKNKERKIRTMPVETPGLTALVSCDGLGGYDLSDQAEEGPTYALMDYTSTTDKDLKKLELMVLGYKLGNLMPPKCHLSITKLDEFSNEPVVENCDAKTYEIKPKDVRKNNDAPIIKEWVLDDEEKKASGSNVIFLILYVDEIMLMGNRIPSLQEVKTYLGKCFSMKDLGEAAFILGIKIYRDRSRRLIGLSQNAYLDKILKRYRMDNSKRSSIPMQVDLYLSKSQCVTTSAKMKRMQNVSYASAVGSIMYAVRCTRPDVVFAQNITS